MTPKRTPASSNDCSAPPSAAQTSMPTRPVRPSTAGGPTVTAEPSGSVRRSPSGSMARTALHRASRASGSSAARCRPARPVVTSVRTSSVQPGPGPPPRALRDGLVERDDRRPDVGRVDVGRPDVVEVGVPHGPGAEPAQVLARRVDVGDLEDGHVPGVAAVAGHVAPGRRPLPRLDGADDLEERVADRQHRVAQPEHVDLRIVEGRAQAQPFLPRGDDGVPIGGGDHGLAESQGLHAPDRRPQRNCQWEPARSGRSALTGRGLRPGGCRGGGWRSGGPCGAPARCG